MGGPRKATAPKVTTTPTPETAVVPDPDATGTPVPVVPVADGETQTLPPGADGTAPAGDVTPDPATPDFTPTPAATPAAPTSPDTADAGAPAEELADVTEIVMNIAITGTVDGTPWPAPGGAISLPTAEAERYVRLGYARFPEE